MAKKKPPPIASLAWTVREVLEPGTPVSSVACANGSVVIGGARLYRVAPGGWGTQYRGMPEGAELPVSVAVEPRPPHRIAVGPEGGDVIVFTDTTTANSIIGHMFTETRGSKQAVQLSWVVNDGQSTLFALADDGQLFRMQTEGWDTLEMPPIRAIAHDGAGGFGALTVIDGAPRVYISRDGGEHFHFRALGVDVEAAPDAPASMALAGMAVAVTVGDSGPLVNRGVDAETTRHPAMKRAYTVLFQGSEPDAWIYVGLQREEQTAAEVWLLDAEGNEAKVMDFLADDHQPLDLGQIVWDPVRKAILIASRGGLIGMCPELPRARKPRAKKPLPQ